MKQALRDGIGYAGWWLLAWGAAACGGNTGPNGLPDGLASCPGSSFLTVAPIDVSLLKEIVPLGNLNPSGHTLPTDHTYWNVNQVAGVALVTDVVAPGNLVVTEVSQQTRSGGTPNDGINYGLRFYPCADVAMYFAHLTSLSPALAAQVGAITACDPPYTTGGITNTSCRKEVSITLSAGAVLGTAGGPMFPGIDFGGADARVAELAFVNPSRSYGYGQPFGQNRTICPIDYFVPAVATALRARLGRNGAPRTIAPVCGTIMQDIPNTVQGRWYFDTTVQDDPHLALAHDNGDPRIGVISVGTSVPSIPSSAPGFTPATTGRVNLDFSLVTADGQIYCYQSFSPNPPPPLRHILIQLVSATRVRIEGVLGATCGDPSTWAFTGGAREFTR